MSEEKKKYTCIKPTVLQSTKVTIGDEVELTDSQARPLKNGGFITFDEDAAKCIRLLAKGEEEGEEIMNDEVANNNDIDTVDISTNVEKAESDDSSNFYSKKHSLNTTSVGFEKGD